MYKGEDEIIDLVVIVFLEELADGFDGPVPHHSLIMGAQGFQEWQDCGMLAAESGANVSVLLSDGEDHLVVFLLDEACVGGAVPSR